ncbi:histidine phosphatase family protein [Gemmobacter caeruleus]|uniref:histidine phosphatase family protein n=1 Tax=Gemmobacter caeruleus TaxID=2595004 RepID=UPI0011EC605F|nr:histidine phosphatase family protein [Gemmobacter caeruleus]
MTRFWWVRHGPTHERAFCGWRDVPADLSDTGALARLRAFLPEAPILSSDLLRARQTAEALAGPRPRLPADPDLREFHFGAWEGLTFDAVAARDPDLSRAYWECPGDVAPPEGESWNRAAARVDRAVARLTALGLPDLIVVAHFGVILTRLQQTLGQTADQALAQRIEPLSVTCLHGQEAPWINHIP